MYLSNRLPGAYKEFGYYYYLIPRIIRESFKTPFYCVLFASIIYALNPIFQNIYTSLNKNTYYSKRKVVFKKERLFLNKKITNEYKLFYNILTLDV